MAAIADIKVATTNLNVSRLVTTSATVGVDRTLSPSGFITQGVPRWEDRAGGVPVGYPSLSMSFRRPQGQNRNYKVSLRVHIPTLEQIAPSVIWTKAYDCAFFGEFVLPERSTVVERSALLWTALSLLAQNIEASDAVPTDATGSPVFDAVRNLAFVY